MTTETRLPLAGYKGLPMLRFPTKPRRAVRRIKPATGNARKAVQRSLKIECLEATYFRAHVSAAPLKHRYH